MDWTYYKGKFLKVGSYMVQYPVVRTNPGVYTLQTCSIEHHFNFFGKHPATVQLMR